MATKKTPTAAKKTTARKGSTAAKRTTVKPKAVASRTTRAKAQTTKKTTKRLNLRYNLADKPLVAGIVVELVGTFMLAAAMSAGQGSPTVALFGLAAIILGFGWMSGGYLNPALVVGALVTKKLHWIRAVAYIVAQVLGGMLALVVMQAFANGAPEVTGQAAMFGQSGVEVFRAVALTEGKEWFVFFAEFTGAAIFAFIVASAAVRTKLTSALTYGTGFFLALVVAGFAASAVSANVALNPALAITYGAVAWSVWPLAVYVLAPVVGAIVGYALHSVVATDEV